MRRIHIHLDEQLDDAAAEEAARRGISKAAFVRDCVAFAMRGNGSLTRSASAWEDLIGWLDGDPVTDIDEAVYGSRS